MQLRIKILPHRFSHVKHYLDKNTKNRPIRIFMRMGRVSRLGIGDGDGDAVDLHAVVGGDEDEAPPVDDPGLHHIAVLRRHGDLHLRGGDLEFSGLDDVPGVQGGVLAVLPAAGLLMRELPLHAS